MLYHKPPNLSTRLIEFGEKLEDPGHAQYFYHVALALGPYYKIEADGKTVAINPIDYGKFEGFRPPIPPKQRDAALAQVHKLVGEPYDWWLIIDDALKYGTCGVVHLPVRFIKSEERHAKICSSFLRKYFEDAEWGPRERITVSPEDIYLAVKAWPVGGQT
ncbi:hypothetical protein [Alicyclobacillus sp. ALC3]|uniref:hypothetical protein n=1 Tax=Alicyclobacillus sp. ALC3 TaxID=2796143 RepID=UPI00237882ED|nr:hypothetical protein [Alicyclobacillus sp. ALC3]WDL97791.1 hypothetical protein JC200_03410 [Alicyclobacillus sp. ALC3]